jgi:hypothetical protein
MFQWIDGLRECGACEGVKEGCVNCYDGPAKAPPEDRGLDLRPPTVGLARPPYGTLFVILMLAGVAYDGLLATLLWLKIVGLTPVTLVLGRFVLPLLLLIIHPGFVFSQLSGRGMVSGGSRPPTYTRSWPSRSPTG